MEKGGKTMRPRGAVLAGMMFLASGLWGQANGQGYRPAGVTKAGDIVFPVNSALTGVVTLGVSVDSIGAMQNVAVVRDLPPLTAAAQSGLSNWRFTPATKSGVAAAGDLRVHIVFNPYNPGGTQVQGGSQPTPNYSAGGVDADFQPAQLVSSAYAQYPENTVAGGTVVALLNVDAQGVVGGVRIIRGLGPFSGGVMRVVRSWKFLAASYKGTAMASVVPVAFVFASAAQGTP
jgi:Gram-negative bacterial TonB protein C-terminal